MSEENKPQNLTAADVSATSAAIDPAVPSDIPPGQVPRLGFAANVSEAAKHIHTSVNSQGASVRASDKLSAFLVPATSAGLMAAVLCAGWARMAISVICMAALLYYILGRIGIMRTLSARQATLVWHIILGTFLLGIVFTFVYLEIVNRVR